MAGCRLLICGNVNVSCRRCVTVARRNWTVNAPCRRCVTGARRNVTVVVMLSGRGPCHDVTHGGCCRPRWPHARRPPPAGDVRGLADVGLPFPHCVSLLWCIFRFFPLVVSFGWDFLSRLVACVPVRHGCGECASPRPGARRKAATTASLLCGRLGTTRVDRATPVARRRVASASSTTCASVR